MLTVLNDIHAGAVRSSGTTPASQLLLRAHIHSNLERLMPDEGDVLFNGDLFDTGNVALSVLYSVAKILSTWLDDHPTSCIFSSAGNHDLSKSTNILSSFQFLNLFLSDTYPDRFIPIEKPMLTPYGYVIPHLPNQDLFDQALKACPHTAYVFVHANYNSGFAAQSDQSLNLSAEQAEALPCHTVIFGHEHHGRAVGKVLIPGNQIASSVSDWLSPGDKKFVQITKTGPSLVTAATRASEFTEMNWKELTVTDHKFVRVTGSADAADMGAALAAINKFRAMSPALVISNGVETVVAEGTAETFSSNLESVQSFDIMKALAKILTKAEMDALGKLVC